MFRSSETALAVGLQERDKQLWFRYIGKQREKKREKDPREGEEIQKLPSLIFVTDGGLQTFRKKKEKKRQRIKQNGKKKTARGRKQEKEKKAAAGSWKGRNEPFGVDREKKEYIEEKRPTG